MSDNYPEGVFEDMSAPHNQRTVSFEFTVTCSATLSQEDYMDEKDQLKKECKERIVNTLQDYVDNVDVT